MPRLPGYRERLYANFYDAMPLLTFDENYVRMFGNVNVGNRALTNMQCAGQMSCDSTFIVANVYTRTNIAKPRPTLEDAKLGEVQKLFADGHSGDAIGTLLRDLQWERSPLTRALEEWSHTAIVTVVFGDKPVFELNFHDLMDGPALGPAHVALVKKVDQKNEGQLADFSKARALGRRPAEGVEPELVPWRKQLGRCLLLPVRQNLSVQIQGSATAARALKRLATEAGILPAPFAWVHLEGLLTRDIY